MPPVHRFPDQIPFEFSFAQQLEGLFVPWRGADVPAPRVLRVNHALASQLGIEPDSLYHAPSVLAGMQPLPGGNAVAMAYAGHQFGHYNPQLGDGRALLLGELRDSARGRLFDIHLKGAGRTPFSRGGDGKAGLGPVLREYLISEAMAALGIPTTRALAVVTTGETILRDTGPQPGAILVRVAASHLRIGTFQYCAAQVRAGRQHISSLRRLLDYTCARHYPDCPPGPERALCLLEKLCQAQAKLVAQWMLVGFVHGVMNTDNMALSGETIDYGPCAFLDAYDPDTMFSSIDRSGRYAYGQQPLVAQWNLARFAEALLPLIAPQDLSAAAEQAGAVLSQFPTVYHAAWMKGMRQKMGLQLEDDNDHALFVDFLDALQPAGAAADYSLAMRQLSQVLRGDTTELLALGSNQPALGAWLVRYQTRLAQEKMDEATLSARAQDIDAVNPLYIPRNHLVETALQAATQGDMQPFDALLDVVRNPYHERPDLGLYSRPAPASAAPYVTYCGT